MKHERQEERREIGIEESRRERRTKEKERRREWEKGIAGRKMERNKCEKHGRDRRDAETKKRKNKHEERRGEKR